MLLALVIRSGRLCSMKISLAVAGWVLGLLQGPVLCLATSRAPQSSGPHCQNPLLELSELQTHRDIRFLPTPHLQDVTSDYCPQLNGNISCCSANTYADIVRHFQAIDGTVLALQITSVSLDPPTIAEHLARSLEGNDGDAPLSNHTVMELKKVLHCILLSSPSCIPLFFSSLFFLSLFQPLLSRSFSICLPCSSHYLTDILLSFFCLIPRLWLYLACCLLFCGDLSLSL